MIPPPPGSPGSPARRFGAGGVAHRLYNVGLSAALLLLAPAWVPWALLAGKRRRNFAARLGLRLPALPPRGEGERIWVHAVSVGETLAAVPLVRFLRSRRPGTEILFSTVTLTGQEVASRTLAGAVGATFFFPFDLPGICGRFLDRIRPDLVAILETELWPNFLAECSRRGIPAVVLNGRISERSFRGYRRFRGFFSRVLGEVEAFSVQTEEDRGRLVALGADPGRVAVGGNMKFDAPPPSGPPPPLARWLLARKGTGNRWIVAASTHEGEEEAVLGAFRAARAVDGRIRLLLAPRHPERFGAAEQACARSGLSVLRRTRIPEEGEPGETEPVLLLDSVGELASAFAAADLAFVGGSLVPKGGHNLLEPALFGVPVVTGPHLENFREIADAFRAAEALTQVDGGEALARLFEAWARAPDLLAGKGARGKALLDGYRGATARNAELVERLLDRRAAGVSR